MPLADVRTRESTGGYLVDHLFYGGSRRELPPSQADGFVVIDDIVTTENSGALISFQRSDYRTAMLSHDGTPRSAWELSYGGADLWPQSTFSKPWLKPDVTIDIDMYPLNMEVPARK